MSYDIYFINSSKAGPENINEYLETEVNEKDPHFISKATKIEIRDELADSGLKFETFEGDNDDYMELNFETYQVCMSNSEVSLSLPYWHENSSEAVANEIKVISNVLTGKRFTGYDPQTEQFFTDAQSFSSEFSRENRKVSEYFSTEVLGEKESSEFWRIARFPIIFVVVLIVIKLLLAVINRFF